MDACDRNHAARDDEPAAPRGRMTPLRTSVLRVLMGLALMLAAALPAVAQEIDVQNTPVLLQADELIYNEDLGVVTARGNVEMSQGDRLLMADTVTYNQQADTVTASGRSEKPTSAHQSR